jgi:nucleoside-diphosphate-sugar epimerase
LQAMNTERALITGAAGFIGTHLARALVERGVPVRALVRPARDASVLEAMGVQITRGDATDALALRSAAEGCGTVFHLAASRGPQKLSRRSYLELNLRGAEAVGQAALAAGARRLVFTSTAAVCHGSPLAGPWNEATVPVPTNNYRESRVRSEQALRRMHDRLGLPVVIARLPAVMGPGAVDWRSRFRLVGDGRLRFLPRGGVAHPGDVADIVEGLMGCAEVPNIEGMCFMLSAPEPITVHRLNAAIAAALGVSFAPREVPAAPFLSYLALARGVFKRTGIELPHGYTCEILAGRIRYDIGLARTRLGFSPRYSVEESIRRTAAWLRERELL